MALTGLTGIQISNLNVSGIATFEQTVGIAGTLTYEDVTNVDSVGLVTARDGIKVSGGQVLVGSGTSLHSTGLDLGTGNITGHNLKSTGIITATSFSGDGSNLTGIAADKIFEGNTEAEVVDTGSNGHFKVTTEGTERLRILSNGKIGIGTDNPSQMLTVGGTILKTRSDSGVGLIYLQNDGSQNGQIVINQNAGVTRVKLDSAGDSYLTGGNLGLGANNNDSYDSIARNLLLASSGNTGITIRSNASSNYGAIHFADGTSGAAEQRAGRIIYEHSSDSLQVSTANAVKLTIASDGNVHINTADNGNASAKLNIEDSSSAGAEVLKIMNKPAGANGKAKLVFHTETSAGQGCQPYIQSLSGADAGPNASNSHNAGGFEVHTRSGGSGTDNNALRIRDDGSIEKYGANGNILFTTTGSDIEFSRGGRNRLSATHANGYFDFHTGGQYTFPAMRLFASPSAANGAKVGINTDSIGVDAQMSIMAPAGMPALYSSYGMRIMGHPDGNQRISNATGIYAFTASIPANNTYTTVAIGRYHAATVTMRVGDAASKRSIFINYDFTQPAYGVAHLNVIANNGQWNTGSADVQISSSGSDYAIQVRHNSYYNTSNNSGVYMIFNVC